MGALEALAYLGDTLQAPFWLGDSIPDLPPAEILSCENGLLHLPTLDLMPHTPAFFTHNAIDYRYDPHAAPDPAEWFEFLNQLWPSDRSGLD